MQQRKLLFYLIPYTLLSSAAAICLTPSLFASLTYGLVHGLAETALRWAGLLCTCAAALVLMVYAAHAAKNPMEKLPCPTACRRALHTALLLSLTEQQPIRQLFRAALHTWKARYKTLLFWCAAVMAAQTVVSLLLRFAAPTLFSTGVSISLITALFSGILQAFLFFKLLIRYSRPVAQLQ